MDTYPIAEPTSALTFGDLITEVAYKIGCAYYGSTGADAPSEPIDSHDLILCQRIVNKAIRMFINDGFGEGNTRRANGWRWLNQIAQVDFWPMIAADSSSTTYVAIGAYDSVNNVTPLTLHVPSTAPVVVSSTSSTQISFYPSMELRNIYLGGNPPSSTQSWVPPVDEPIVSTVGTQYTIKNFLSPTLVQVAGKVSSTLGSSTIFSMVPSGDYTLPADFSGEFTGEITYVQNTNRGMILQWTTEASIRSRRQNYNFESGTPYECAVRLIPRPTLNDLSFTPPRNRWELMAWRIPSEFLHVIFPYKLGFNDLVNDTDVPPSPFAFDEALKAACLAVAEKEVNDELGIDWQYYKTDALPKAWQRDDLSAPKKLGYFSNPSAANSAFPPIRAFRDYYYQRPTVPVFGTS
jgi:hypothetical protein